MSVTTSAPATELRISLAQINAKVGDIAGNVAKIKSMYDAGKRHDADLVVCPEMVISGYPAEDLVQKRIFQQDCFAALQDVAQYTDGETAILVGLPLHHSMTGQSHENNDPRLWNAMAFCVNGKVERIIRKCELPNYGVFDEWRRYQPAEQQAPITFKGVKLGVMICEDMWYPETAASLKAAGAEMLIVPHGSPFRETAIRERQEQALARHEETGLPLILVNQVGGQDELVFDGGAFIIQQGARTHQAPRFVESEHLTIWQRQNDAWQCTSGPKAIWYQNITQRPDNVQQFNHLSPDEIKQSRLATIYQAVTLGVRDYVQKNFFKNVVIGLSGGVDSALTAAIAVDALGAENVRCVMMPSRYTAGDSVTDADECADMLGVQYESIAIKPGFDAMLEMTANAFEGLESDTTEENMQSRIRGVILMAISNKFGPMVLTTGNKSEMSVGYATLYGDMNGGYNPLKDIYKMDVFALCHWRNQWTRANSHIEWFKGPNGRVIPENIIVKPPSAELRDDQRDDDSLPPYEILDAILHGLVEEEASVDDIEARGIDRETILRVQHLLYIAEYKRRQAPPGPKVTPKNFGRDRRYPITNGYRDR